MMIWWPAVIVLAAVHFCSGCVVGQLVRTPAWLRWLAYDRPRMRRRSKRSSTQNSTARFTVPSRRTSIPAGVENSQRGTMQIDLPPADGEVAAGRKAEPSPLDDLKSDLVDLPARVKQLPAGAGEQRGETRYPATLAVVVRPLDDELEPIDEYEATTSDISRSGISLIQMHATTAKLLDAEIQIGPGERLRLLIEVRHQRKIGGLTVIGGRFLKKEAAPD